VKLSILTGSAQTDKLARLVEYFEGSDEVLVLCATAAQEGDIGRSYALSACSEQTKRESCPDLQAISIGRLIANQWNRWGDNRALVGSSIRTKVIEQVLAKHEVPLALRTKGGKRLLSRLAAAYVPACASGVGQIAKQTGHSTKAYLHHQAIEDLLIAYHKDLQNEGYIEHQYAMQILADKIEERSLGLFYKKIIVTGFKDFTQSQLKLLCACTKQREVVVILDYEEGNPATEYTEKTLRLLLERGAQETDLSLPDKERACELVLGRAQGFAAEVALMADFAEDLHREHPEQSKALLIPRMQNYVRPIARELERRDIPFEIDVKTPFGSTGFGAAFLALLRICVDEEAQFNGRAFVMSAYSGLDSDAALELDTRWRRYRASSASILSQLSRHESGACDSLRLIMGKERSARIGDWSSLITALYAKGAQSHMSSNFDLLQSAAAQKSATTALQELYEQEFARHSRNPQQEIAADGSDDKQPGTRILSFDPHISAAELYAILRETLVAQTPNPASPAILLAQPERAYGRQFHSVIAGGLSARDDTGKPDSTLDVHVAADLSGFSVPDRAQQQQFSYYATVALAKTKLYLVAQHETLGGETLKPGGLLNLAERTLGTDFSQLPCSYKYNDEIIPFQSYANPEKQAEIKGILAQEQLCAPLRLPPRGESMQFDLGYTENSPVAATTLQNFANCPYNWVLQRYAAGAEIERDFDAREQGNFAHRVLKAFYEELSAQGIGNRITEANLTPALALYRQVFDTQASQLEEKILLTSAERTDLAMLRFSLADFLRSEVNYAPEFVPRYLEYRFGDAGDDTSDSASSGPLDVGIGLPLRGAIDRIDVRADDSAALIIDYKRKSDAGGLTAQANNNIFQGVLYRKAAESALSVRPVAHSYRSYADLNTKPSEVYAQADNPEQRPLGLPKVGRGKTGGLSEKKMTAGIEKVMTNAQKAASDLRAGRIERRKNNALCIYCLHEDCEYKPAQRSRL